MNSPDFNFEADDAMAREQTLTVTVELLHAKDQAIAALRHQLRTQEELITALCDHVAEGNDKTLPPPLQALVASFRTH